MTAALTGGEGPLAGRVGVVVGGASVGVVGASSMTMSGMERKHGNVLTDNQQKLNTLLGIHQQHNTHLDLLLQTNLA